MPNTLPSPADDIAVIHHDGSYAIWSLVDSRPITTGMPRAEASEALVKEGLQEHEILEKLENARQHGSSVSGVEYYPFKTASDVIEENCGGAFGEEVPGIQMFNHLLIECAPLP